MMLGWRLFEERRLHLEPVNVQCVTSGFTTFNDLEV